MFCLELGKISKEFFLSFMLKVFLIRQMLRKKIIKEIRQCFDSSMNLKKWVSYNCYLFVSMFFKTSTITCMFSDL